MDKNFKIIFLFGAGTSIPAGLPDINEMTREYVESHQGTVYHQLVVSLLDVAGSYFERKDIESFLSLLHKLKDKNDNKMFKTMYSQISDIQDKDVISLIISTQKYVREKLEQIGSLDYISNLKHLPFTPEVFTLNYDSVIENTLENGNIKYSDGFDPFWNTSSFERNDIQFKLYKLHGSLYWFTTTKGKLIKVPIKGLEASRIKYITGEDLTEVIIYPTIQKIKFSRIYSFLDYTFTDRLSKSNVCVIIGYSFRDEDITKKLRESIQVNNALWILIINPNSKDSMSILKNGLDEEPRLRIGFINSNIQDVLNRLQLNNHIENMSRIINREKEIWDTVNSDSIDKIDKTRLEWNLAEVINGLREFGLIDRGKYIISQLSVENKITPEIKSKMEGILRVN